MLFKTDQPLSKATEKIMKFIFFTLAITLSSLSFSSEKSTHETHENNQHGQHNKNQELIFIQNPMIKTTPPGITNSAAYFTINNNSEKDITLIGVASDAAQRVEMHEHIISNGNMKMQRMEPLKIAAKSSASFQPGGYHVMFIGVTQAIKSGDKIVITLTFDDGTSKTITSVAKQKYKGDAATHKHH
jgi:copper(I)-binding protein